MYLSNSSEIEDQTTMTFSGVMDEVMSIMQAEEVTVAATSSLTY
jgi:hypothetical protein